MHRHVRSSVAGRAQSTATSMISWRHIAELPNLLGRWKMTEDDSGPLPIILRNHLVELGLRAHAPRSRDQLGVRYSIVQRIRLGEVSGDARNKRVKCE